MRSYPLQRLERRARLRAFLRDLVTGLAFAAFLILALVVASCRIQCDTVRPEKNGRAIFDLSNLNDRPLPVIPLKFGYKFISA